MPVWPRCPNLFTSGKMDDGPQATYSDCFIRSDGNETLPLTLSQIAFPIEQIVKVHTVSMATERPGVWGGGDIPIDLSHFIA